MLIRVFETQDLPDTVPTFGGGPPAIKASLTWEEWLMFLRIWGAAIRGEEYGSEIHQSRAT